MHIVIKPLEKEDFVDFYEIHYASFSPGLWMLWYRKPSPESFKILADERASSALNEPGAFFFKAVDTDANKIVGVSYWTIQKEERTREELEETHNYSVTRIPEINHEARDDFIKGIDQARLEVLGTAPAVVLHTLLVRPEYQRKGIGNMLMKFGMDEADR
jgi:GNAT superfamily N-acetyltransferase